ADALAQHGDVENALIAIDQALQLNPDARTFRPELFRVSGELFLRLGQAEEAAARFREAIALAQMIGAKSWELRATMSFARLLPDTARRDEARTMLADVYGSFSEGFDTVDLKEAKALLEELDGRRPGLTASPDPK